MLSIKFQHIPQPVFPNQRNDEKIYVFSRRHVVDYFFYIAILSFLFVLPLVIVPFIAVGVIQVGPFDLVYARDLYALIVGAYYLFLAVVFLASWINYYYNIIIVTDERVVDIYQVGLFSREINELVYEQIEDVSCKIKGILNTLFHAGDIEIQTAGSERNFVIKRVPHPHLTVEIILELAAQAKRGVDLGERVPDLETIGVINSQLVGRGWKGLPVMNLEKNLKATTQRFARLTSRPEKLREKIDCWWRDHCYTMHATFGESGRYEKENGKLKEPLKKPTEDEKADDKMVDL
ncbi:MAG: PH domain-containing protein [Candidatus Berkelbacteria bacterium]|nr:PH domain-containing protein [Candidatus Berkelbacteria bacterium]